MKKQITIFLIIATLLISLFTMTGCSNKNENQNDKNKIKETSNTYDINDIEISKLGHYITWSVGWKGTVNFLIRKPLGDEHDYFNYEKNENGVIIIADGYTDIYNNQSIDSVMEQSKDKIVEYLNKS